MRVPISSVTIAALLCSVPFASVVRGHPVSDYTAGDIVETSKRAPPAPKPPAPKPPPRTPSPKKPSDSDDEKDGSPGSSLSDPFSDGKQGSPGSTTGGTGYKWRGFTDKELRVGDIKTDNIEKQRFKGEQIIIKLEDAIRFQSEGVRPQSIEAEGYLYSDGSGHDKKPDLGLDKVRANPYMDFGLDVVAEKWIVHDIKKFGSETIVKTYEEPEKHAMVIAMSNNKKQDPEGKMSWSAMVMNNWRDATATTGTNVADLKYIIRNNIQSRPTTDSEGTIVDTIPAMREAFASMPGADLTKTLTLDFNTRDKTELQQVGIMSAQTHVARVLQMLKDYRGEFKDLKISKIHLQSRENPVSDQQWNIIIELGRYEQLYHPARDLHGASGSDLV